MKAYRGIALAIAVGVLLQAAFIAFAWFDVLNAVEDGTIIDDNYDGNAGHAGHGIVGMTVMPLLGIALLVSSFFVKVGEARKRAGIVLGLIVLQVVLAFISFGLPALGALHGLNAFAVLASALYASRLATAGAPLGAPSRESTNA